jgi:hypothetical protein
MLRHKACHDFCVELSLLLLQVWQPIVSEHCLHKHGHLEFIELFIFRKLLLQ